MPGVSDAVHPLGVGLGVVVLAVVLVLLVVLFVHMASSKPKAVTAPKNTKIALKIFLMKLIMVIFFLGVQEKFCK